MCFKPVRLQTFINISNAFNKSKAIWGVINTNKSKFPKENIKQIKGDNGKDIISDPNAFNNFYIDMVKPNFYYDIHNLQSHINIDKMSYNTKLLIITLQIIYETSYPQ